MAEEKKDTEKKQTGRKPAAKKPSGSTTRKSGGTSTRRSSAKSKETATKGSGTAAKADARARDSATRKAETADEKALEKATSPKPTAKQEPAKKAPAKRAETKPKGEAKAEPRSRRRSVKEQEPERPVVNARARFVRVAPRKARLVADQVRGLPLEDALPLLRFSTRSAAQDIRKLLESAAANAEANHDLVADDLRIKDIHVDEGPTLRRYRPRALGRATRINKRTSHIVVALTPEE